MFRSPWELDAYIRHRNEHLVRERQFCAQADRAAAGSPGRMIQMRRRLGVALIRVGALIAGLETLPRLPAQPASPSPAYR
jgi:hypothetical protein